MAATQHGTNMIAQTTAKRARGRDNNTSHKAATTVSKSVHEEM
jgi:hypothetical protein